MDFVYKASFLDCCRNKINFRNTCENLGLWIIFFIFSEHFNYTFHETLASSIGIGLIWKSYFKV